ncbi:uncharacterized protein LOC130915776 [Corythoichthys intestinalis]|uniref:uncharacterized protein LOC130915776 n=1 Tax=Corythoichthys intestinalis TaxID=161448 RepID=UPI0025A64C0D|nr:uncharacterized protein LOC130915776 [Corythoichthys intestinalis]
MSFAYKMTERDIRKLIELRAANSAVFTGEKHSAVRGWRAICQEMGLQGVLSARQLKKKWDNLKVKYKVLKNPPVGMETTGGPSWRWFRLMDEAVGGRPADERRVPSASGDEVATQVHFSVDISETDGDVAAAAAAEDKKEVIRLPVPQKVRPDGERSRAETPLCRTQDPNEHYGHFERDRAALERERAALKRDRAALERDRAALERDRMCLDRDRACLDRDRAVLERERARPGRENARTPNAEAESPGEEGTEFYRNFLAPDVEPQRLERTQRLVCLFNKLADKLEVEKVSAASELTSTS